VVQQKTRDRFGNRGFLENLSFCLSASHDAIDADQALPTGFNPINLDRAQAHMTRGSHFFAALIKHEHPDLSKSNLKHEKQGNGKIGSVFTCRNCRWKIIA
jgi:hypothetical protein